MAKCEPRVEFDASTDEDDGLRHVAHREAARQAAKAVGRDQIPEPDLRWRVARVQPHGFDEGRMAVTHALGGLQPLAGCATLRQHVDIKAARCAAQPRGPFCMTNPRGSGRGDAPHQRVLSRDDVAGTDVRTVGPEVLAIAAIDQLRVDDQIGTDSAHAALDQVTHA